MKDRRSVALEFAHILSVLCLIVLTVVIVRDRLTPNAVVAAREPKDVANWRSLANAGHRIGADDPVLTLIEFGDYECPGCRQLHERIERFLREHDDRVAFVYRHWPLAIHAYAYDAARAAECAGTQGRFWEYHSRLFEDRRWINNAFVRFAVEAGVGDIDAFSECISDGQPVESIEADIEAIREIGAFGTPAVIANGVLLAGNPTLEELEALLAAAEAQT